jgi:transposase
MLQPFQPVVFSEFDQLVFQTFVPADHYLRNAKAVVDFERFRASCEDAYDSKTMGRPAIDVILMLKILFLRFHYRLSDRQVVVRCRPDIAFRFFLDLPAKKQLPDHTTSTYFRQRLGEERFERVFQELVGQAREHGLIRDRLRLKDATHMLGDIADLRPLERVAQVRDRLLDAAEDFFAAWVLDQREQVETLRQSTAELTDDERLAHRLVQLRAMTQALQERVANLPPPLTLPDRQRDCLTDALTLAQKLLGDHDDPKAGDRLVNAVDPDARMGKHGRFYVGYMLDVAVDADSELITAINVLPANGAEAADAVTLIEQEESAQGNDVEGVSIDGAGYNGPVLRELSDPEGLNLDVTVPTPEMPTSTKFGPERFSLNVLGALECPAGQTTKSRDKVEEGYKYRFTPKQCAGCSLRGECLQKSEGRGGRSVIKNEHEVEYAKAQAKTKTAEYAATRKTHPRIERKLADLTRNHGARRAVYRGLWKVRIQAFMTAMVVNVKRMIRLQQMSSEGAAAVAGWIAVRAELG